MSEIGFGCNQYQLAFYVEHPPTYSDFAFPQQLIPLPMGAIYEIGERCGNGWRKQFNVYAKFIHSLSEQVIPKHEHIKSWQAFRDNYLLQQGSHTALLFSPPIFNRDNVIHIIAGRGYAKKVVNEQQIELTWLNKEFAFNASRNLLVSPFLDYRQLSNIKIDLLAQLYSQLKLKKVTSLNHILPLEI